MASVKESVIEDQHLQRTTTIAAVKRHHALRVASFGPIGQDAHASCCESAVLPKELTENIYRNLREVEYTLA